MKERREVAEDMAAQILGANRHTCCICRNPRQPVEIHHIDSDPSNNTIENLAVVCRNCHGLVTARSTLGRHYSKAEVSSYKQEWEALCRTTVIDPHREPVIG